ncbi:MAG: hypothetical protein WHS46_03725 [Desulfosoma sp.]
MKQKMLGSALVLIAVAGWFVAAEADHREDREHKFMRARPDHVAERYREDHGNETSGRMAAWLLASANLPVTGTVLTRWFLRKKRTIGSQKRARALYTWFKDLMPFHYVLNAAAIAMALIHFRLSWCLSTNIPEWAILLVTFLGTTGIVIKFRILPHSMVRWVRSFHTNPLVVVLVFALLFLGHRYLD